MMGLLEKMLDATHEWAKEWGYKDKNKDKTLDDLSKEQREIVYAFRDCDFEYQNTQIAKLVSKMTGIDMEVLMPSKDSGKVTYKKHVVVVPLGNDNSHNYPIGEPCMCIGNNGLDFLKIDGSVGNFLTSTRSLVRPATDDEIRAFYEKAFS